MRVRPRSFVRRSRVVATIAATALAGALTGPVAQAGPDPIEVQLLNLTDFHGALAPQNTVIADSQGNRYTVGGGAYLPTHLDRLAKDREHSVRFTAGDSISSSPAFDLWHGSEPSIEFLNHVGMDFNTIGNHELDISAENLIDHIWKGKCLSGVPDVDTCFVDSQGKRFKGSQFPHLAANLVYADTRKLVAPPYVVKTFPSGRGGSVRVAFLNATFQKNGNFETQSHQPDLLGLDTVETVNKYAEELDRLGIKAIVLSMHEGGRHEGQFDNCVNPTGPAIDFARQISPKVDVIFGGHTHRAFTCMIDDPAGNPRAVVQAGAHGQLINETNLRLDPATGEVTRETTRSINHPVTVDVDPDPTVLAMADYWRKRQQQTGSRPIAEIAADFTTEADSTGQTGFGNAAADAMYEDSQLANDDPAARAELAMVPVQVFQDSNPFGANLRYAAGTNPADAPGRVLFEEWRGSFGYRNPVVTVTVTGAAIHQALEGQWRNDPAGVPLFKPFAVSGNVRYSFDPSAPVGDKIDPSDVVINGVPLDLDRKYRLAGLTFNLWGRDGHTALGQYTDAVRGSIDHDAFLQYLKKHSPASPPARDRVTAITK